MSQWALDEDEDIESQPENRNRRPSMVGPESRVPGAKHLDELRITTGPCPPESVFRRTTVANSKDESYKDKFALIHVHRVSFRTHIP